jgi:hypothetical protein
MVAGGSYCFLKSAYIENVFKWVKIRVSTMSDKKLTRAIWTSSDSLWFRGGTHLEAMVVATLVVYEQISGGRLTL